jgi:hypothetical protein
MQERLQQRNQLASERQQLSNDLSKLQRSLRDTARTMAPNQPQAAQKLRQALTEMDEADLDNHMQRTADWLRRGINPNSNGTESEIAKGLDMLRQHLRDAERSADLHSPLAHPASSAPDQTAALEQLQRLRRQLDGLNSNNASPARSQSASRDQGRPVSGGNNQTNSRTAPGNRSGQQMQASNSRQAASSGEVQTGAGGATDGTAWNNINTGNNTYASGALLPVPADGSGNPQDSERFIQQQMHEFEQLRRTFRGNPNISKEIRDLTQRMQNLDPKRFPGNPALVDQMKREMIGSIDRMELQLLNQGASSDARLGKPSTVPDGYQNEVADYYRRLSQTH